MCFNEINYDNEYQLLQNESRFEAVNGSRIECLGYVCIPVVFYGFERNYRAKIKFYVIRNLGLQGLELQKAIFTLNSMEVSAQGVRSPFVLFFGRDHKRVLFLWEEL